MLDLKYIFSQECLIIFITLKKLVTDKKIYVLIINFTDKKIYVLIINFIRLEIRKSLYSTRVIRGEIQEINTHLGTIFSHLKGESPP